jgi:acetyl-CoA C-acetyltransferase
VDPGRPDLGQRVNAPVYVLGGYQTDFARNWAREGRELLDVLRETALGALEAAALDPEEVETAHVGNFAAELFCRQGHLGGLLAAAHPGFAGLPCARHEAACASGSIAVLAATAELEAGRYGLALVLGVEQMRNVPGRTAAEYIGAPAMWSGHECAGVEFPWPHQFGLLGDEYERRFGLRAEHLAAIARLNFANARRNPLAQTRSWTFGERSFAVDDEHNPVVDGRIRKHDCGQITDGAAAVVLASPERAAEWARRRGRSLEGVPRLLGFGHRTAPISLAEKLRASGGSPWVFPHVRGAIEDAFRRAGLPGVEALDAVEVHDCFTTTEYMAIDHFGITPPGQSWKAIEEGWIAPGGRIPVNPSGGLIGAGHPVGATGVRMLLDASRQVAGLAGETQVEGARRAATLNIGGSATTTVDFVVGT